MAYPQLLRFDPLAVRISETSLMISNVVFSAECVVGLAFTGFRIYASSVGNPIYEKKITVSANVDRNTARNNIAREAGLWLTGLQNSVINVTDTTVRQTSIKDSIDRAGWQQHFDLVGNSYPFPSIDWGNYSVDDSGNIQDAIVTQTQRINAMNNTLNTVNTNVNTVRDQVYDAGDGNSLRFYTKRSFEAIWKYDGFTSDQSSNSALGQIYYYTPS